MRSTLKILALTAAILLPLSEGVAQSALLTESFGGTRATAFNCGIGYGYCFVEDPLEVGANGYNVQLRSGLMATSTGMGSVIGTGAYGLAANGHWDGVGGTYAGTDDNGLYFFGLRFSFSQPVYSVGAWMNYAEIGSGVALLRALDVNGSLIAQYDLRTLAPIATPTLWNAGAFRGIESTTAIYGFELAGSYLVTRDLFISETVPQPRAEVFITSTDEGSNGPSLGAQDTQSPTVVTPEPGTYVLVAAGLAGLGFLKRRRRA